MNKTGNDEDSRALQNLGVIMLLAGNFLLNFTVMGTLATVLLVLSHSNFFFFSGIGILKLELTCEFGRYLTPLSLYLQQCLQSWSSLNAQLTIFFFL